MTAINSQEDFLRALSENPEWKAAVRAQILGEELLQLPARFDVFVAKQEQFNAEITDFIAEMKSFNAEMKSFVAEQKEINTRMELRMDGLSNGINGLRGDFEGLNNKVGRIGEDVNRLTVDSGRMRGHYAREAAIKQAEFIAMDMGLEYVRTLPSGDLARMVLKAAQGRPLSNDFKSFRLADLVIEATDGETVQHIAVEASFTGDYRDTNRALRNASFLTEFTGRAARAAIASVRNDDDINWLIVSGDVYWHEIREKDLTPE